MKISNNYSLIQNIIKNNGGYITRRDINSHNIPSMFLSHYVKRNNLIKYCTGFYATNDWIVDSFLVFQYQYPKLVYSFSSAIYLHGLGDYNPPFLEVTAPKNYRPFPLPREGIVLHTDINDETYHLGITEVVTIFGNKVKVYDVEKTVCDLIRHRKTIDSESFVKCIHAYKRRDDKNINLLMDYAKKMKIVDKVNEIMEVVLNED